MASAAWTWTAALLIAMVVRTSAIDSGVATLTVSGQGDVLEGVGYYHYGRRIDGMPAIVNVSRPSIHAYACVRPV